MKTTAALIVLCSSFAYALSQCVDSDGVVRTVGEYYIGQDGCNTCKCMAGDTNVCTKMACLPGHRRCLGPSYQVFNQGDTFPADDGCNTCTCSSGGTVCTANTCTTAAPVVAVAGAGCIDPVTGQFHAEGSSFKSSDGCNTCGCSNGMMMCTEMACLQIG